MTDQQQPRVAHLTGGCQCGSIRFALYAQPDNASICHCRMCQKALGNLFSASTGVERAEFAWTRGAPKHFNSSAAIARDFCGDCGTPLTFRYLDRDRVSIALGALDRPEAVPITSQYGIEGRIAHFEKLASLPGERSDRGPKFASRQHPDHETEAWPGVGKRA